MRAMSLPSASMMATEQSLNAKAIRRPSGDQSGRVASPSRWVIWRRSLPFGRTVKIWMPWSVWAWNAMRPLRSGKVALAAGASASVARIVRTAIAMIAGRRLRIIGLLRAGRGPSGRATDNEHPSAGSSSRFVVASARDLGALAEPGSEDERADEPDRHEEEGCTDR